tara:strand:- start:383 stop:1327 length:945 start_codon:yes stop_codon:yes gene_type:complete
MKNIKILITGSAGYIGSCLSAYLNKRFTVYNLDKKKTNQKKFFKINLKNKEKLNLLLKKIKPQIIIHLAGESLVDPKKKNHLYIENNIKSTNNLLECMKLNNLDKIIFSSTAAVYKDTNKSISEKSKIKSKSNYGKSKIKCEKNIIKSNLNYIIFRFFNVCSCLTDPLIGENHKPETHLIPLATKKSLLNKTLYINGNNYSTKDGTCIRDYIHIKDICSFINKSIKHLLNIDKSFIFNLGSGKSYSILDIVKEINKFHKLKYKFTKKRKGDPASLTANIKKVSKILKWKPFNSKINRIIKDQFLFLHSIKKIQY